LRRPTIPTRARSSSCSKCFRPRDILRGSD
jgi:hypothetical protein